VTGGTGGRGGGHGRAPDGPTRPAAPPESGATQDERVARMLERCIAGMAQRRPARDSQVCAFFVPGRLEVFGKHTDYAGGRSLLAAVERGFVIASAARDDDAVRIAHADTGEAAVLDGSGGAPPWARYPATVLRRLDANFPEAAGGADIVFTSDLPAAAGLSSSSAFVIATFLALDAVRLVSAAPAYRARIRDDTDLAGYLAAAESGLGFGPWPGEDGVGTHGGSEDHTAILAARPGDLVQYGFAPIRFESAVALPGELVFVVAASGVTAEKAGGARAHYNALAADANALASLWREATGGGEPHLGAILAGPPDAADRLREVIRRDAASHERPRLLSRLEQFAAESGEIVPAAAAALRVGDASALGSLAVRSTLLAADALQNQLPETLHLAASAPVHGALAASPFGAGFGGSVWALAPAAEAAAFAAAWRRDYLERFPGRARDCTFFVTRPGAPACRLL
jgi:galactokinase